MSETHFNQRVYNTVADIKDHSEHDFFYTNDQKVYYSYRGQLHDHTEAFVMLVTLSELPGLVGEAIDLFVTDATPPATVFRDTTGSKWISTTTIHEVE